MFVAAAYRAAWDRLPVRRRGKSGLSAGVLTMTPPPWMIRRTGRNRFGHELRPYASGESPATALGRAPDPIYPLRSSRREQVADRRPARCSAALSVTTVWLGRATVRAATAKWEKRVGSCRSAARDSPLTHRPPGYRHDVHGRADQSAAAVIDQHARGRAVFPRRRTGAKSQPTPSSLRPRCAWEPPLRTCRNALVGYFLLSFE